MKHIDLFSGIGGFSIATEMVWDEVDHLFCDNEPFAQAVLLKHWPNSLIHDDIRTLANPRREHGSKGRGKETSREKEVRSNTTKEIERFDRPYLLTGGFPCQPFSQAGARRGTEDSRHLWPEMLRVIREFRPRWIIGENVGGLVTWSRGLVLEQIHTDLEGEGYEVQAFIIPAVSVNAPHRRDRIWIVAHSTSSDDRRGTSETSLNAKRCDLRQRQEQFRRSEWEQNWVEVATRLCRVDDGIPRRMDRNPRLKALGNAIVPQVAAEMMNVIKEIDDKIRL